MDSLKAPSPGSFLHQAIKAVPAVKWALAIGGILSVPAISFTWYKTQDIRIAALCVIGMLFLMMIMVVFAKAAGQPMSAFQLPALVFTWFCLVLFIAISCALFGSIFFDHPHLDWSFITHVSAASGSHVETQPTPSETIPPVTAPSATPEETPTKNLPKEVIQTPTDPQIEDQQNEAKAHSFEELGDDAALHAISLMYCGLQGCNNKPANQADTEEARRLWAYAVSEWSLAYNTTHDSTYSDRLREKMRPESGVSCDDHSCESNFTHENRALGMHIPVNQFDPQ